GGIDPLLSAPMPRLKALWSRSNGLGRADARVLARAAWPSLRLLDVRGNPLDDTAMQILRSAPWFERLETFRADDSAHQ
ncbi:MAG: hypothetical protein AAGI01_12500, partial [Myxococcota bacterium]